MKDAYDEFEDKLAAIADDLKASVSVKQLFTELQKPENSALRESFAASMQKGRNALEDNEEACGMLMLRIGRRNLRRTTNTLRDQSPKR